MPPSAGSSSSSPGRSCRRTASCSAAAATTMRGTAMQFTDRTVVITGASGNLGRAAAKSFADLGARLALLDLRRGDLQDQPSQVFLESDLLKPDSVAAAVGKVLERFGAI